ncbi:MAG: hypothetical protein Dasosvirus4_39 [Dasosvirus sp.]|uniref:Uncharacterized protein n=1 Tax=Dasosvirus sp. TaxID=2487764 RepID=A0A3G4ZRI6_9VIRU|nr:MAG: hypothetical protein Dasosvirus4_39 [Dasosvirus sp.]
MIIIFIFLFVSCFANIVINNADTIINNNFDATVKFTDFVPQYQHTQVTLCDKEIGFSSSTQIFAFIKYLIMPDSTFRSVSIIPTGGNTWNSDNPCTEIKYSCTNYFGQESSRSVAIYDGNDNKIWHKFTIYYSNGEIETSNIIDVYNILNMIEEGKFFR